MASEAHLFQINTSGGGVPKTARNRAEIGRLGLDGDRQDDTVHHGGPERAVSLYSLDRILALQAEGHPILPGSTGENLTLAGLDWLQVVPGVRLRIGPEVELQVTSYASPCDNIAGSFAGGRFVRISEKKHPGWARAYARVLREGSVTVGDAVELSG